jgi:glycosyltransferase involved in cell wall biosynthesis
LLPATLLCSLISIPVVTTLHMPLNAWGWRHRLYWRAALRLSSLVVGVSREVLSEVVVAQAELQPVPGAVSNVFLGACRPAARAGDFAIAAVGRLSSEKDWPTLLQAVALLPASTREKTIAHFFGDGPLRDELKSLATRLSVRSTFHGHLTQAQLADALRTVDVSVLPSHFEGLGLAALESMASGVPTITSNFPAARDFIREGKTGHTFPVGDSRALAALLGWHFEHPAECEELGRAGRRFVESRFSASVVYRPYLDFYMRVAA